MTRLWRLSGAWLPCLLFFFPVDATFAAETVALPGDALFDEAKVVRLHLTMTESQFAGLAPAGGGRPGAPGFGGPVFGRPGFGGARSAPEGTHRNTFGVDFPWSQGNLEFDGQSFPNVGVRYKGNYTYLASARSLKKSLKIDLNRNVKGQKLDGLTMINLHCGVSDPTRARESLSYAYFRDAGVPASRTTIAELILTVPGKYDGEFVGAYTLVEQINKAFLKRHFQDASGMLLKPEGLQGGLAYLGADWRPYEQRYRPEDPPNPAQQQRLIDFTRLIASGSDEAFAQEVGAYLEVDAFLRFIAVNALLSNMDSYLGYGHNYYLYLVPATNKFVFMPWDLDLSLATWPAAGMPEQLVELSIHHPHAGENRLIDRLFAIPQHKERYLAILRELTETSFTRQKLLMRLEAIEQALQEPLAAESKAFAQRREGAAAGGGPGGRGPGGRGPGGGFGMGLGDGAFGQSMPPRRFIERRTASVAAQLAGRTKGFEPRPFGPGPGGAPGSGPGFGRGDRPDSRPRNE